MLVREVKASDAKSLLKHANQVATETIFLGREVGELDVSIEEEEKLITRWNESRLTNFIVCIVDGNVVASCIVSGREGRKRFSHIVTLGISVNKDFWGKGIGSKMMEEQIKYCQANAISKINLEVMTNNTSAIKLYQKYGFEIEGTNINAIRIDNKFYDNYYMGLIL